MGGRRQNYTFLHNVLYFLYRFLKHWYHYLQSLHKMGCIQMRCPAPRSSIDESGSSETSSYPKSNQQRGASRTAIYARHVLPSILLRCQWRQDERVFECYCPGLGQTKPSASEADCSTVTSFSISHRSFAQLRVLSMLSSVIAFPFAPHHIIAQSSTQ